MADLNFGSGEKALGSLFHNLAAGMQQGQKMNAARKKLAFEKQKYQLDQARLAETKKKNTMNAAIKRIETLMPGGKMFQLKENAPALYKNLLGQYLTQGFPEIDPQSDTYKTMLQGLTGDGPHVKNIVSFLSNYSNKLTSRQRITLVNMVKRDPGSLVEAMEQAGKWGEAFTEQATLTQMAKDLEPQPSQPGMGAAHTPQSLGVASIKAIGTGLGGGLLPKDLSISALGGLGGQIASRERSQVQSELDLNRTVMVQATPDAAPRSILASGVGKWLEQNSQGRVFSQQALTGTDLTSVLVPKRQAGKVRGVRVKMAGLMSKSRILLDAFERLGSGIGGFRGTFGNIVGGIAGQISPILGEIVTKGITGASPQELAHFRSDAQALIAETVPVYTGEESGRISEPELRISKQATKVLAGTASQAEIVGALKSIINATFLKSERALIETSGELTWGFIRPDGSRDDRAAAFAYDKIKKVSKMDKTAVLSILSDLATQQRSLILGGLWEGLEAQ
jgi:hypothetical protein